METLDQYYTYKRETSHIETPVPAPKRRKLENGFWMGSWDDYEAALSKIMAEWEKMWIVGGKTWGKDWENMTY